MSMTIFYFRGVTKKNTTPSYFFQYKKSLAKLWQVEVFKWNFLSLIIINNIFLFLKAKLIKNKENNFGRKK
jgi:ABC-type multidrug transport system permease subunit